MFPSGSCSLIRRSRRWAKSDSCVPVLCNDGVAQNLLLGGAILTLLGERRLVLLLLEFATHLVCYMKGYKGVVVL